MTIGNDIVGHLNNIQSYNQHQHIINMERCQRCSLFGLCTRVRDVPTRSDCANAVRLAVSRAGINFIQIDWHNVMCVCTLGVKPVRHAQ